MYDTQYKFLTKPREDASSDHKHTSQPETPPRKLLIRRWGRIKDGEHIKKMLELEIQNFLIAKSRGRFCVKEDFRLGVNLFVLRIPK